MKLIVGPQRVSLFMDTHYDLCRNFAEADELITIDINRLSDNKRKQQLVVCPFCLGKLVKASEAYLGNLIIGAKEKEEIVEL